MSAKTNAFNLSPNNINLDLTTRIMPFFQSKVKIKIQKIKFLSYWQSKSCKSRKKISGFGPSAGIAGANKKREFRNIRIGAERQCSSLKILRRSLSREVRE